MSGSEGTVPTNSDTGRDAVERAEMERDEAQRQLAIAYKTQGQAPCTSDDHEQTIADLRAKLAEAELRAVIHARPTLEQDKVAVSHERICDALAHHVERGLKEPFTDYVLRSIASIAARRDKTLIDAQASEKVLRAAAAYAERQIREVWVAETTYEKTHREWALEQLRAALAMPSTQAQTPGVERK